MTLAISSFNSAASSALQGIASATAAFDADAQAVSGAAAGGDVTAPLLDMSQESLLAQANARVLATMNQTLGTLLDVTA